MLYINGNGLVEHHIYFFFKFGFTPCKAEQPLRGMELQEKEAQKRLQHTGNLLRKNLQLKDVC